MAFDRGPISFTMCTLSKELPDDAIEKFAEKKGYSLDTVLDEPQVGWVSGRHLLDTQINEETLYAGAYLHLFHRCALRKVPTSLLKAEIRIEELALMQSMNSQTISRKQKKEIKEDVTDRLLKNMPPSLSGIPCVIDKVNETLYLGAASKSQIDQFLLLFYESIGFEPVPLTPEIIVDLLHKTKPDSIPAVKFSRNAPNPESSDDLIGRDFATWIWYFQEIENGTFEVDNLGEFSIMIDGPLVLAADGNGALEVVVKKGLPTISAEAKAALSVGKKIRQAKFTLVRNDEIWSFTLDADSFAFRSMTLPVIDAQLDLVSHFEERIRLLDIFRRAFLQLFDHYFTLVTDSKKLQDKSESFYNWVESIDTESAN